MLILGKDQVMQRIQEALKRLKVFVQSKVS
jgi:hypothetical protein